MMLGIGVEQSPDHPLILGMMLAGFPFEKLHASLAQRNGHFDTFVPKDKFFRPRQKIRYDPESSEGFVRVFYFLAHRFACLSASNRLRKSELRRREM
jgi:hypothetical protein